MKKDRDLIPLDALAEMAKWIAKHREEENVIVITVDSGSINVGVSGDIEKLLCGLNHAIYHLVDELKKERN
jgi:hypothetical protein